MKKVALFSILLVFALAATACVNKDYDLDNTQDPQVTVPVDKTSTVQSGDLFGTKNAKGVTSDAQGEMRYEEKAEQTISASIAPVAGQPTPVTGTLKMDTKQAPEVLGAKSESDLVLADAGVIITVNNPAPDPVLVNAKLSVDGGVKKDLPEVLIPGGKATKILFSKSGSGEGFPPVDKVVAVPDGKNAVFSKVPKEKMEVSELTITKSGTKAVDTENYTYTVDAEYCCPFTFAKGAKIHLDKSFSALGVDVSDLEGASEYELNFNVSSNIPFIINLKATSKDGLNAVLDTPLQAGKLLKPVTTAVKMHVTSSAKLAKELNDAVLSVDLEAAEDGASLNTSQKLVVDYKSFKIIKY